MTAEGSAPPRPIVVPWWAGLPVTLVAAAAWVALAGYTPTTTYHFAPSVVACAWPIARRLRLGGALPWREAAATAAGAAAIALATTAALAAQGLLAGPTFLGEPGAAGETVAMAVFGGISGAVAGVLRLRRSPR